MTNLRAVCDNTIIHCYLSGFLVRLSIRRILDHILVFVDVISLTPDPHRLRDEFMTIIDADLIYDFGILFSNIDFIGVIGTSYAGNAYLGSSSQSGTNSNFAGVLAQYNVNLYGSNYHVNQQGFHEFELGDYYFSDYSFTARYFSN